MDGSRSSHPAVEWAAKWKGSRSGRTGISEGQERDTANRMEKEAGFERGPGGVSWETDCSFWEEGRQRGYRPEEERKTSHAHIQWVIFLKNKTKQGQREIYMN